MTVTKIVVRKCLNRSRFKLGFGSFISFITRLGQLMIHLKSVILLQFGSSTTCLKRFSLTLHNQVDRIPCSCQSYVKNYVLKAIYSINKGGTFCAW